MFIVYTVQEMTCIFNNMAKTKPTLLTPGNIQTPKSSGMRPTAHFAYRPTISYEHTRTCEGSRKEGNKQEGEENP